MRYGILAVLLCFCCWVPVGGQASQHVSIIIVSSNSAPHQDAWAQTVADKVAGLAHQDGISPGQLSITRYDFDKDADREHCTALHVDRAQLMYVGVLDAPDHVLFYLRNIDDLDRTAVSVVESARGLLSESSESAVVESPGLTRQSIGLYVRLLRHPETAKCHLGPDGIAEVMKDIRARFVDPISERQMEKGMVLQVGDLLQAAGLSSEALERMPVDGTLPGAILAAYGGRVDPDVLSLAEVRGALLPLQDPYSAFLTPDQAQVLTRTLGDTAAEAIGIHLEASPDHVGQVVVLNVLPQSPAAEAGVEPGDILLKVDGKTVEGLPADLASSMLGGTEGSTLVLTLQRGDKIWDATIKRRVSKLRTVAAQMVDGQVGYVHLAVFAMTSGAEMQSALETLRKAGARAFILDLRNNGGGYVKSAQQICSLFLPKGQLIMSIVGRGAARQTLVSTGPGTFEAIPVVVLVNGSTASAAEITAGCLRDHKIAYLMGSTTFGKGSMQTPFQFPDQAMLKLTVGRWYSPSGIIIDKVGLTPTIPVPGPVFGGGGGPTDEQFHKAYELLHGLMGLPH